MHKQDISEIGKETDVLSPKIGRSSEKVSEMINDYVQIKREDRKNELPRFYEGQRINNINVCVGRQKRGKLFRYPECDGPVFEGYNESTGNEQEY
jgi:hypothetical protein